MSRGIYIYGAGDLGALALEYCEACRIPVLGILDGKRVGYIRSVSSREYAVMPPDGVPEPVNWTAPVAVAIATLPFGPIREQLEGAGWKRVVPFYNLTSEERNGHPLRNGWLLEEVTQHEFDTVEWLCQQWSDEVSIRHYEAFVAWHRDNSELSEADCPIEPDERYAIPQLVQALSNRCGQFVDVGSHRGESVGRLKRAGLIFSEYILIEPDKQSRSFISSHQQELIPGGAQVALLDHVLGSADTTVGFAEGLGYCSQVWSQSTSDRSLVQLDALGLRPDLLKVHTEGTEHEILRGAQRTIAGSRPCIAFSVYHRRAGFHDDIAGPMKMFDGYRWYFRMHSHQGTGAFVYAIPID
ncbi:MAG: FkbM family methyltransferase [Candidatus Nanopelagicales bacterium]